MSGAGRGTESTALTEAGMAMGWAILSQLHPSTRVGRNLGTCLRGSSPAAQDSSEPWQSEIPRREPLRDEEVFDIRRIPDDGQPMAITDELNLAIHRRPLKLGR